MGRTKKSSPPDAVENASQKKTSGQTPRAKRGGRKTQSTAPTTESSDGLTPDVMMEDVEPEVDEPIEVPVKEDWEEVQVEDPLEILEDPTIAIELSEDPVRLYLKEIGQINLLDADSEFRLAARIEAERFLEVLDA